MTRGSVADSHSSSPPTLFLAANTGIRATHLERLPGDVPGTITYLGEAGQTTPAHAFAIRIEVIELAPKLAVWLAAATQNSVEV